MAWQQHSPMPETAPESVMLKYRRELRAAEARDRLEVDVENTPPRVGLLLRLSRVWARLRGKEKAPSA